MSASPSSQRDEDELDKDTNDAESGLFGRYWGDNHEEYEEGEPSKPYRNRSASWSERYRKLLPYEKARRAVLEMGFTCKDDWDEYVADGKVFHGPYLPNYPDEMYADDWVSWDEFLGLMRPYDETRHLVRTVLRLRTLDEYMRFVGQNPKRAQGLRIPWKPHIVYKNKGWTTAEDFFGTTSE